MATNMGPCSEEFDDWEDALKAWENADAAADKAFKNAMISSGAAIAGCILLPLIGCALGAVPALNNDTDSIVASLARNEAYEDLQKAKQAFKKCAEDHKKYYPFVDFIS